MHLYNQEDPKLSVRNYILVADGKSRWGHILENIVVDNSSPMLAINAAISETVMQLKYVERLAVGLRCQLDNQKRLKLYIWGRTRQTAKLAGPPQFDGDVAAQPALAP